MKSEDTASRQNQYTHESVYLEEKRRFLLFVSFIAGFTTYILIYIGISVRIRGWSASFAYGGTISLLFALGSICVLLRMAKGFLLELYKPDSTSKINQIILRRLFGFPFPPFLKKLYRHWVIIENGALKDSSNNWVTWLGGPALLRVMDGSAVYLERGMRFSRVEGSGDIFLHRDETIRHIVNLRSKGNPENKPHVISAWTKDGIRVDVGVYLKCKIGTGHEQDSNKKRILPFHPIAVQRAVEATTIRFDENENKLKENGWLDLALSRLRGKLAFYIGSHNVDELLREGPVPGTTVPVFLEEELKAKLDQDLASIGLAVQDLKIDKVNVDPIVKKLLTESWSAERKSLAIIEEGISKAEELRCRLKKELEGTREFEKAIGEGVAGISDEYFAQHFSLYLRELANVDNPIIRAQVIERLLKSLDQFKDLTGFEK